VSACTVKHRTPETAARCGQHADDVAALAATADAAPALDAPVTVTVADLRAVASYWSGRLVRFTGNGLHRVMVLNYPHGGETIVDAADVHNMVAAYGGWTQAAAILTDELRHEQTAGAL
jgi:hypothetical protein